MTEVKEFLEKLLATWAPKELESLLKVAVAVTVPKENPLTFLSEACSTYKLVWSFSYPTMASYLVGMNPSSLKEVTNP